MSLRDVDLTGKRVVMRVDFNVPVKEGVIIDDTRIKGALPSIKYVLENGGKLILMSHMGRPDEKGINSDNTMKLVADYLSKLIGKDIVFVDDCCRALLCSYGDVACLVWNELHAAGTVFSAAADRDVYACHRSFREWQCNPSDNPERYRRRFNVCMGPGWCRVRPMRLG